MNVEELKQHFESIYPALQDLSEDVSIELRNFIRIKKIQNIDFVKHRIKDEESFIKKANRLDDKGQLKYPNPFFEIQDIIGIRIIVYYLSDVDKVFGALKDKL